MPFPTETALQFLRNGSAHVATEFEQMYAQTAGWMSKEHESDGSHGDITADSVTTDSLTSDTVAADSLTLSDGTALTTYVEADFTPVVNFGGATTGITYTNQIGRYTRVGRLVTCLFNVLLSSKGSATGAATITGLPVTVGSASNWSASVVCGYYANFAAGITSVNGSVTGNTATLVLTANGAGGTAALDDTSFTNTSGMLLTVTYFA